jgi:hypothetical protein
LVGRVFSRVDALGLRGKSKLSRWSFSPENTSEVFVSDSKWLKKTGEKK